MRKYLIAGLCSFALLAIQSDVAAQTIGFKVGPTFSNVKDNDDSAETDQLTSLGGGGFVRFGLGGLALQAEVLALTKGFKGTQGSDDEVKLTYIAVPVSLMYALGEVAYVFAGGEAAFESKCEVVDDNVSGECDLEGDDDRASTDFGVHAGVGIQFGMGPGAILVEGRHVWGTTNLNADTTDSFEIKNRSIYLFVGYAIPIGR